MKKTTVTLALSFIAALAATPVLADESIDCFYEANRSDALCQTAEVAQPASSLIAKPEYIALESITDESIDCFYDANRWNAACAASLEMVVLGSLAE
jgi:hypothetical protein